MTCGRKRGGIAISAAIARALSSSPPSRARAIIARTA